MPSTSTPCIFFQRGHCRNGNACRFSHSSTSAGIPNTWPDPRSQIPCKFYQQGNCREGTNCPYQHGPHDSFPLARVSLHHDKDTAVRVFCGVLVRYGDGATVTRASLLSEYSSIRLDGLPANTTPANVLDLLSGLGHNVEIDGLKIVPMPQCPLRSAYISTLDPEFSRDLSTSLMNNPGNSLKAITVPPRLPSWASTRRARCNHLKLKWTAPYGFECFVYFRSYESADNVSQEFEDGRIKIQGLRVHAKLVPYAPNWAVWLTGLPPSCRQGTILSAIGLGPYGPYYISTPQPPNWQSSTVASIKEMVREVGPIDFMTEPSTRGGYCWTLSAHFKQDSDALAAVQIVEHKSRALLYNVNLIAKPVYNSTFKMSKEIYEHVQNRIQGYVSEARLPSLEVTCQHGDVVLSLDGGNSEVVAERASAIEEIVAGDVIKRGDGTPFWVPQLESNGSTSKLMREIQERHGVLLLPNRSKREIRCFGDLSKQAAVQEDVVRSLTEEAGRHHTVDIDSTFLAWLVQTGLDMVKDAVGEEIVSLDVTSNPKKLTVRGSDEEYSQVLALLRTSNIPFHVKSTPLQQECSVCSAPAIDPITIGCGHTFCTQCFKDLCRYPRSPPGDGPQGDISIICRGAEDTCKSAVSLKEIQAHADPLDFEQLLESTFHAYINRRTDQFHKCPTPDCSSIYRLASDADLPSWHMCNQCVKLFCRSCHKRHAGQTCSEHDAWETFEEYKRRNSATIKDCPKCRTTMEKIDGCNDVQCAGCKVHICWVCMETFEDAQQCHMHLSDVHVEVWEEW
ncbi:hypothetical protein F5Y03DRAFT_351986 [Xylaria venustula]|nr:hypothetical protein F5Y03DRAFT_351986 [Xylaria venustula]